MTMKNTTQEPAPAVDGAFLRALQEHRQGEIITELSTKMREAVEVARKRGKTAKVILEITLSPNNSNAISFAAEVTTKLPKEDPYAGIFFSDENGNLFRNDPLQQELPPLRTVEPEQQQTELRKVS